MPSRILAPFLGGLVLALVAGGPVIAFLRRLKAGQFVSSDAPERHRAKAGTPTMGGLIIVGCATLTGLAAAALAPAGARDGGSAALLAVVAMTAAFMGIGFLDDFL